MDMRIDEPWHKRSATTLDYARACSCDGIGRDCADLVALDEDVGALYGVLVYDVDELDVCEQGPLGPCAR